MWSLPLVSVKDFDTLISGSSTIDLAEMKKEVTFHRDISLTERKWFWNFVKALHKENKVHKLFLFWTGI
jgi:hypothetical protein